MPYLTCTQCQVRFYSASIHWHRDECPGCGHAMPPPEARERLLAEPIDQVSKELSRESGAEASGRMPEQPGR